jgi:hypothetical protein
MNSRTSIKKGSSIESVKEYPKKEVQNTDLKSKTTATILTEPWIGYFNTKEMLTSMSHSKVRYHHKIRGNLFNSRKKIIEEGEDDSKEAGPFVPDPAAVEKLREMGFEGPQVSS